MSLSGGRFWLRPMLARDRDERHRAATPLELLFDLCFVVAVGEGANELAHGIGEGHILEAVAGFLFVFFAVWWAWMNFTWFASAYDTDDVPYRLLTLLQISGVLVLAAGVPSAFGGSDLRIAVVGYVIMRVAMVMQWLRAAHDYTPGRRVALRFAFGVGLVQVAWVARLALVGPGSWVALAVLVACEMAVPIWAESAGPPTAWHPEHIAERYGLFTLIVLGECVLAATTAIQASIAESGVSVSLLLVAAGALLLIFGLWWSYFKVSVADGLRRSPESGFVWGYGHYVVFAAIAALGAGLELAAESARHTAHVADVVAALAVAVPVAIYLVMVAVLHGPLTRELRVSIRSVVLTAVLVLAAGASALIVPLPLSILLMGILVATHVATIYRAPWST
jgi:low temperature requirement protein LtrA